MSKTSEKKSDLRKKNLGELKTQLEELQLKWQKEKIDLRQAKIKDVHGPRKIAKDIARIKTIIRIKELMSGENKNEKI